MGKKYIFPVPQNVYNTFFPLITIHRNVLCMLMILIINPSKVMIVITILEASIRTISPPRFLPGKTLIFCHPVYC